MERPTESAAQHFQDLFAEISKCTEEIKAYLNTNEVEYPSFSPDTIEDFPPDLHDVQRRLLSALDEFKTLIQGPRRALSETFMEYNNFVPLHAILRYKLAEAFPIGQSVTYEELGARCGRSADDVARLLRPGMTYRIFEETAEGRVKHTAATAVLARDPNFSAVAHVGYDELLPAAARLLDAHEKWPGSQESTETGFNLAHNTNLPIFRYLEQTPGRSERFAASMLGFMSTPPFALDHLSNNYDFSSAHLLVDIGGSSGATARALASRYPQLRCVVQDLPAALETITQAESDHGGRVTFQPHDFLQAQPVKDADIYLLRWVLHDLSDKYAAIVLRNVVASMKPGAKILINDTCLPRLQDGPLYEQRFQRLSDLTMWQIQNGRERDEDQWSSLLLKADLQLKLREIRKPEGSALAILIVESGFP